MATSFKIVVLILSILLCSACGVKESQFGEEQESENHSLSFDAVLSDIHADHAAEARYLIDDDITRYMRNLPESELGFSEIELQNIAESALSHSSHTNRISPEAAASDIDILFRMFYYSYGCYEYFGGKARFEAAEKAMLADIAALGNALTVGDLFNIIRNHLAFVRDAHVTIDDDRLLLQYSYYYTEQLAFQKDTVGFWTVVNDARQYITAIDGDAAIADYMKLSISSEGSLQYQLGYLDTMGQGRINVGLELDGVLHAVALEEVVTGASYNRAVPYAETMEAGISVISYRTCMDREATDRFIAAKPLFEQGNVVLDLRGNTGGSRQYADEWLKAVDIGGVGRFQDCMWSYQLRSKVENYLMAHYADMEYPPDRIAALMSVEQRDAASYLHDYRFGINESLLLSGGDCFMKRPHDSRLFVLMDQRTASAAEYLLSALRCIDNVIFVGTNSAGRFLGNSGTYFGLPHSKLHIGFGDSLKYYYDEPVFIEGRGFLPDIWVGGDALTAVLALVQHAEMN